MATRQDEPRDKDQRAGCRQHERLGKRGHLRHQQGARTRHYVALCQRERDEERRCVPAALALAELFSQADAERHVAVQLGSET